MRYSAKTKGFYDDSNYPKDSVEISYEYYKELLEAQDQGNSIEPNEKGLPIVALVKQDSTAVEERVWRNLELQRADIELNKVQDGEGVGSVQSWRDYRKQLRAWPQDKNFPLSSARPKAPDTKE